METNETIHGFRLTRQVRLSELSADLYQMRHENTGLELVWLDRADENKTFGISFATLPEDDTGVFHILEHSVLCGSRLYPVKEPFVELMKSSLNTFLNAFTFPDKTMYPVSSRNETDFMNLVRVYLDAVFCPSIYTKPEIFRQEGWHYEPGEDGIWQYRGVVFNEMKGAFADPDELTMNALNRGLFPDTPYRFVSGGDPASIPDLTYESFLSAHRRFYSPSNAFVFLDGSVPLPRVLQLLDKEYLAGRTDTGRVPPSPFQAPVDGGTVHVAYEPGPDEDPARRHRTARGLVVGAFDEREKLTAVQALVRYLSSSNHAPLKRALLDSGLAEDVHMQMMDDVLQPWVFMDITGLREEDIPEAERIADRVLEKEAEGLDRDRLSAELTNLEFRLRERDYGSYPPGLMNGLLTMGSWLYGGLPEANLEIGTLFDGLRAKAENGYFEEILRSVFLSNPHRCSVHLHPDPDCGGKRRDAERSRLDAETGRWTEEQRREMLKKQEILLAWQTGTDTKEQLATLPRLTWDDIQDMPEPVPSEAAAEDGVSLLLHETDANGIVYATLFFDAEDVPVPRLRDLSLLCGMLGKIPTARHSVPELQQLSKTLCGNMSFSLQPFDREDGDPDPYRCKLGVSFSALEKNLNGALELVCEILTTSVFDDRRQMLEIVRQLRQRLFESIVTEGLGAAVSRVSAPFSPAETVREETTRYAFYRYLRDLEQDGRLTAAEGFAGLLRDLAVLPRLTVSLTGRAAALAPTAVRLCRSLLPEGAPVSSSRTVVPAERRNEGILIPADVGFAVRGCDLKEHGVSYHGSLALASKIVDLGYLWNTIRVRGGAYGAGMLARSAGTVQCYSYRDPNCAASLDAFTRCGSFLRDFLADEPDLVSYMIGTVADNSPLMSPRVRGVTADALYWRGIGYETRCRRRRELLASTPEQLREWADRLDEALRNGVFCVVGGSGQADACGADAVLTI